MLRDPRPHLLAALLALSVLAGCGIKGPLTLPPADVAKAPTDTAPPTPREPRSEPKL